MRPTSSRNRVVLSLLLGSATGLPVRAGVVAFTDIDEFRAVAGPLVEIDFAVLPDGSPPRGSGEVEITPDFNYTDRGVTFSSPQPILKLLFNPDARTLLAGSPSEIRNWIEAEFDPLVIAVGVATIDTLSVYSVDGVLLAESPSAGFVGFASESPIHLAVVDTGSNGAAITSILFEPVPEPVTIILLGAGAFAVVRRRSA